MMEEFGYRQIRTELEGQNIHSLTNILTLSGTIHDQFDLLQLWLEETVRTIFYFLFMPFNS
jgi:hypothetical protein